MHALHARLIALASESLASIVTRLAPAYTQRKSEKREERASQICLAASVD